MVMLSFFAPCLLVPRCYVRDIISLPGNDLNEQSKVRLAFVVLPHHHYRTTTTTTTTTTITTQSKTFAFTLTYVNSLLCPPSPPLEPCPWISCRLHSDELRRFKFDNGAIAHYFTKPAAYSYAHKRGCLHHLPLPEPAYQWIASQLRRWVRSAASWTTPALSCARAVCTRRPLCQPPLPRRRRMPAPRPPRSPSPTSSLASPNTEFRTAGPPGFLSGRPTSPPASSAASSAHPSYVCSTPVFTVFKL